jgi:hypothetical protein
MRLLLRAWFLVLAGLFTFDAGYVATRWIAWERLPSEGNLAGGVMFAYLFAASWALRYALEN